MYPPEASWPRVAALMVGTASTLKSGQVFEAGERGFVDAPCAAPVGAVVDLGGQDLGLATGPDPHHI
jgi:hypothetical protein